MEVSKSLVTGCTVLVADDDEGTRRVLRDMLRSAGMNVVGEAGNGVQAFSLFQKLHPEVVCLDIDMPAMTGLQVLIKIREMKLRAIVLLITGGVTNSNVHNAITGHADGIIAKPFSAVMVVGEIERAIKRSLAAA